MGDACTVFAFRTPAQQALVAARDQALEAYVNYFQVCMVARGGLWLGSSTCPGIAENTSTSSHFHVCGWTVSSPQHVGMNPRCGLKRNALVGVCVWQEVSEGVRDRCSRLLEGEDTWQRRWKSMTSSLVCSSKDIV